MATVTLRNLGGSVVMTIPRKVLDLVHLDAGAQVEVQVQDGQLLITPQAKPRYTLTQLLANCTEENMAPSAEDSDWLDAKPVGKEAW